MSKVNQFILWQPECALPPKVIHVSREQAEAVAEVMAKKEPGKLFYVCELVAFREAAVSIEMKGRPEPSKPLPVAERFAHLIGPAAAKKAAEPPKQWMDLARPNVGDEYRSNRPGGLSKVKETFAMPDGRKAIIVREMLDRPLVWKRAIWGNGRQPSQDTYFWWSPEKVRLYDPINAAGSAPNAWNLPAYYLLG